MLSQLLEPVMDLTVLKRGQGHSILQPAVVELLAETVAILCRVGGLETRLLGPPNHRFLEEKGEK